MQNRHALKRAKPAVHSNQNSALPVPKAIYAQGKIFMTAASVLVPIKKTA